MNERTNPPSSHKEWAVHLRDTMGGKCSVHSYLDDSGANKTHIFTSITSEGIVAATVGISDIDQSSARGLGQYTEVIMDKRNADDRVANVLSTIAF